MNAQVHRGLVWLALSVSGAAQTLPARFDMPPVSPVIEKTVQPSKLLASTGRRAAIVGREDGSFDALVNDAAVLRGFRITAYLGGSPEPVPLAAIAERVSVAPGRSTIVHSHGEFTVRQTWVAAVDRPLLVVLLDIDTARTLRLRASFVPEAKTGSWRQEDRALVAGEAVIGGPAFTRCLRDGDSAHLEMEVTPETAQRSFVPIVIAGGGGALEQFRGGVMQAPVVLLESDAHWQSFRSRVLMVETPDAILNRAFEWAVIALEKGPGRSGDALVNWAALDYGDFARAGAQGDNSPLFLSTLARYAARTGDQEFARRNWAAAQKAYRACLVKLDGDGLVAGADIYAQGAWLAALDGYRRLAEAAGQTQDSAAAARRLETARAALNGWFLADGRLAYSRSKEDPKSEAASAWQAAALLYGGLDPAKTARAAGLMNSPELSADWGARLFASGEVRPYVTALVAMAEYRHHHAAAAFAHLAGTAAMSGTSGAGLMPEVFSGDRFQALPGAAPNHPASSAAIVHPLVGGLLGLDGEGQLLHFAPHLPAAWPSVKFAGYRTGASTVSAEVTRERGLLKLKLAVKGKPVQVRFSPALPPGSVSPSATLNGKALEVKLEQTSADAHAAVEFEVAAEADLELKFTEGVELQLDPPRPETGNPSRAVRLVSTAVAGDVVTFELAAPAGSGYVIKPLCSGKWGLDGTGWCQEAKPPEDIEAKMTFPRGSTPFSRATIKYRRGG